MGSDDHNYKVKWNVTHGDYSKKYAKEQSEIEDCGFCDAFAFVSIVYPEDGSASFLPMGMSQDGTAMEGPEWFKVWCILAHQLSEDMEIGPERMKIASEAFEKIRELVLSERP